MSLEKVIQKIHGEIKDLAPSLELFLDETIQPSVDDCENLQKQLTELQETVSIYKYNKLNKEISPSFNIHAKVSQKENEAENENDDASEKSKDRHHADENTSHTSSRKRIPNLAVNLNDKFRFINELFAQNDSEYHIALEQINNLKNWGDAEIYLNSLKSLYEWRDDVEVVKYFYSLVKKRFD